jgi:hypothetical protein
LKEVVFADIGRKFLLAVLPEENHENLSVLKDGCVHSYLKKVYIGNSLRKITRISRAQRKAMFTGIRRKLYSNPSRGKSRESQGLTRILCSLAFEENPYSQFLLRIS